MGSIARSIARRVGAFLAVVGIAGLLAGCGGGESQATPTPTLPPPSTAPTPAASGTGTLPPSGTASGLENADIWLEQDFGTGGKLAVLFYQDSASDEKPLCVRFLVSDPPETPPVSACQRARLDSLVVAMGTAIMKRDGQPDAPQLIIAGRAISPDVTTVALEFTERPPITVDVVNEGFIVILPDWEDKPLQAVPINQFGNLVGAIYKFQ